MTNLIFGFINMITAAALVDDYIRRPRWWVLAIALMLIFFAFVIGLSYVIDDAKFVLEPQGIEV